MPEKPQTVDEIEMDELFAYTKAKKNRTYVTNYRKSRGNLKIFWLKKRGAHKAKTPSKEFKNKLVMDQRTRSELQDISFVWSV